MKVKVIQWCLTLCNPMDCSLPGSPVHGIYQARILEWVAFPFSRGSSQPRDRTQVSCITGGFFTIWATREVPGLFFFLCDKVSCFLLDPLSVSTWAAFCGRRLFNAHFTKMYFSILCFITIVTLSWSACVGTNSVLLRTVVSFHSKVLPAFFSAENMEFHIQFILNKNLRNKMLENIAPI